MRRRLFQPRHFGERVAETVVGLVIVGPYRDRPTETFDRFVKIRDRAKGIAEIEVRFGIVGFNGQCLLVIGNRVFGLLQEMVRVSQIVEGLMIVAPNGDCLPVMGDGLVEPPQHLQGITEVVVGLRKFRTKRDRLA